MEFDINRKGTGTREWAEHSYNIAKGCKHSCVYCYAKADALYKYKTITSEEEWTRTSIIDKKVNKKWNKMDGVIMFPTVHDITEENIEACVTTLENILKADNQVLIVSKPCVNTIQILVDRLAAYKNNILFRFTIGNSVDTLLKIIEPGAPTYIERKNALKLAWDNGFRTSVSIEPLLGGIKELNILYHDLKPFVTDSIWVGKMNKIDERVKTTDSNVIEFIEYIKTQQTDEKIYEIYLKYKDELYIHWKDSIKEVVKNHNYEELKARVDKFNDKYKIGYKVKIKRDDNSIQEVTVDMPATILEGHTAVGWFEEISGCYALDKIVEG